MSIDVSHLLQGAVDLGCRAGDQVIFRAREAAAAGMRAIVFKDDDFSPTPLVQTLRRHEFRQGPPELVSGIVLDNATGGLNPYAVEHELMLGGRLVTMPTVSAANHLRRLARGERHRDGGATRPALTILDMNGRPTDAAREILDFIARHDAVLCSGHLHVSEIWPLFEAARDRGVSRILLNHAGRLDDAMPNDIVDLAAMGAFVELTADPHFDATHIGAIIKSAPPDRIVLASDVETLSPPRALAGIIGHLLDLGLDQTAIAQMAGGNAARLLGLHGDTQ